VQILQKNYPFVPPLNINQNTPNLIRSVFGEMDSICKWRAKEKQLSFLPLYKSYPNHHTSSVSTTFLEMYKGNFIFINKIPMLL